MNAIATIRSAPGLESYLERLEARLEASVASHPGLVAEVGTETLSAGGKRLRPAPVFLAAPAELRDGERVVVHLARNEVADDEIVAFKDLVRRRWLVDPSRDRLEVADVERVRVQAPVPADHIERMERRRVDSPGDPTRAGATMLDVDLRRSVGALADVLRQ